MNVVLFHALSSCCLFTLVFHSFFSIDLGLSKVSGSDIITVLNGCRYCCHCIESLLRVSFSDRCWIWWQQF